MDSIHSDNESSLLLKKIVADIQSKCPTGSDVASVVTAVSTPASNMVPSADAILAKWKPSKIDYRELDSKLAELFTPLKHCRRSKDDFQNKKIFKTIFGTSPIQKIDWLVAMAAQPIDEQHERVYAPDLQIQTASMYEPVASSNGKLRRKDFVSDEGYALYYAAVAEDREIFSFSGSFAEYYDQRAYANSFPISSNEKK